MHLETGKKFFFSELFSSRFSLEGLLRKRRRFDGEHGGGARLTIRLDGLKSIFQT